MEPTAGCLKRDALHTPRGRQPASIDTLSVGRHDGPLCDLGTGAQTIEIKGVILKAYPIGAFCWIWDKA